jgi:hypothetical protein
MAIIDKPSDYFNTVLYTGNGSTQSITGVGFQPDWVWIKRRNAVNENRLTDAVRGATKEMYSDSTTAETTNSNGLTSFDSDGFSLGSSSGYNSGIGTYVGWNWLGANGTSANTDGSISSTVSANTTSGFSIVTYTGGGGNATVGHGLGVAPGMMIIKNRSASQNWVVYHQSIGNTKNLYLNRTDITNVTSGWFNNTSPTSTVFTIGNDGAVSGNGNNLVAYCFAEKQGYSKFGSYTGNGNADGTFVYLGFKPAIVIVKSSSIVESWYTYDNKRTTSGGNPEDKYLLPNQNIAEGTFAIYDFLSNGFKLRNVNPGFNNSGVSYIYMAFAENPFVSSTGVPATAR